MNDKRLLRFLERSSDYCFSLKGYKVPKKLETNNDYDIDLKDNRLDELGQGSAWSPKFRKVLKEEFPLLQRIREFPFIIRSAKTWKNLCWSHGVSRDDFLGRNYFFADYFFPDYNLIVEIDSNYHDQNYDRARDEYLNIMFGIHTLRLFEFGVTPGCQTLQVNDFMLTLTKLRCVTPVRIDYSELILYMFYKENDDIMEILNIIEANLKCSVDGIFDASGYQGYIGNLETLKRVSDIIEGTYGIKVVMKAWGNYCI